MRVANWHPEKYDGELINASMERLRKAAEVIANAARAKCPVGTVSRPIYKKGPYAGQPWTARDAGALKKTIRVVEKKEQGTSMAKIRSVRIYAGNYITFYAAIVEYAGKAFLRPALNASKSEVKNILENG
jgi:hypothetical protein